MQHNKTGIGPRGWAILTLVGGAALACLFLRPPQQPTTPDYGDGPLAKSAVPSRLASAQLARDHSLPQPLRVTKSEVSLDPAAAMPSGINILAEPQLPAWATPPSPLDQLISQGAAPPWRPQTGASALEPVGAWLSTTQTAPRSPTPAWSSESSPARTSPLPTQSPAELQQAVRLRVPPPWPVAQSWPTVAHTSPSSSSQPQTSEVAPRSPETRSPETLSAETRSPETLSAENGQPKQVHPSRFVFQPGYIRQ